MKKINSHGNQVYVCPIGVCFYPDVIYRISWSCPKFMQTKHTMVGQVQDLVYGYKNLVKFNR